MIIFQYEVNDLKDISLNRISGDFKFDSDSLMACFIVAEKLNDA